MLWPKLPFSPEVEEVCKRAYTLYLSENGLDPTVYPSLMRLENELMAHPLVAEATVVGLAHPTWQERPVAFVVRKPDAEVTEQELDDFLETRVAKWWLPDTILFVDEIPKTGTGKFDKKAVRKAYANLLLDPE